MGTPIWHIDGTINRANLDGSGRTTLVTGQSQPHGVRLDLDAGTMYWPEFGAGRIHRANLDGTGLTTLVSGLSQPIVVALDSAGGKIYWTNHGTDDIRRANLDGSGQETLITNQKDPTNLAGGDIRRANFDGSDQQILIAGLSGPLFIWLDFTAIPEPVTFTSFCLGAVGLMVFRSRRRRCGSLLLLLCLPRRTVPIAE
jgi:sugar lactone lactonase YvrE